MDEIRGLDEAEEEEDLVVGRSFVTIVECQDTMHMTALKLVMLHLSPRRLLAVLSHHAR